MATTVSVTVSFSAVFAAGQVRSGDTHTLSSGTTVRALLSSWDISPEHQRHVTPIVNQEQRSLSYVLQDSDEVFLYLPVGGG